MSKTITIKGHIFAEPAPAWALGSNAVIDGIRYRFSEFADPTEERAVCDYTLVFQLPESFDPVGAAVKDLEKKREKLRAEFQMALNEINDRIGKLQAITCEVPA
jgi:hypothetical protein